MGKASMSARSKVTGPGLARPRTASTELTPRPSVTSKGNPSRAWSTLR